MIEQQITLLLIDDDPIFRLGLLTALNGFESFQVQDQAASPTEALEKLSTESFDIVIIEPEFSNSSFKGWRLCQQIKQKCPTQKICIVSGTQDVQQLSFVQNQGIEGYCPKGYAISQLVGILQQIAQGDTYWSSLFSETTTPSKFSRRPWFSRLRQSGIEQINCNLTPINQHLKNSQISIIDRLFWQGRKRELLTARWLIQQMLPVEVIAASEFPASADTLPSIEEEKGLVLLNTTPLAVPSLSGVVSDSSVFQNTLNKIQTNLNNKTEIPLEIDVLQTSKARILLTIILTQFQQLIEQLRYSEITLNQLPENLADLLNPLWQNASLTFLSKFFLANSAYTLDDLKDILEEDQQVIQEEILDKIPFLDELFAYLLFGTPLSIQGVNYRSESPESIEKAEKLLQNVMIRLANAVMIFILNNFSEQEIIKSQLYKDQLLSSREIAKFRNELSWQYRLNQYWETPKDIFEDRYRIYALDTQGIHSLFFYCPRQAQLKQLQGVPWLVTIILEIRDATAPRFRSVTGWLGEGLIYVLTQVIGRAIGLVGRGIIQGVGTTWQEARYGKNARQDK